MASCPAASSDFLVTVDEAIHHIRFLRNLHSLGVTFNKSTESSLNRYRNIFLPLVAQHPDEVLIPPPDVAWLWHCHRLAPAEYTRYCMDTFERVLEPKAAAFCFQHADDASTLIAGSSTRQLWFNLCEEGGEEFFQPLHASSTTSTTAAHRLPLLCGFDLLGSTKRQALFLWQVSEPQYDDRSFLGEGVKNYDQFFRLPPTNGLPLVPTYQIDLFWHTHILRSPLQYDADCVLIRGHSFHHDDSLNDRTPGQTLDQAFRQTEATWKDTYHTSYEVVGGMYRGEPPAEYYSVSWQPAAKLANQPSLAASGGGMSMLDNLRAKSSVADNIAPSSHAYVPTSAEVMKPDLDLEAGGAATSSCESTMDEFCCGHGERHCGATYMFQRMVMWISGGLFTGLFLIAQLAVGDDGGAAYIILFLICKFFFVMLCCFLCFDSQHGDDMCA